MAKSLDKKRLPIAMNEELALVEDEPLQVEILNRMTQEVVPTSNDYRSEIRFHIDNGRTNQWVDPSSAKLEVTFGIRKVMDNSDLQKGKNVAPCNNLLHTAFANVRVQLRNAVVTPTGRNYPYVAYLSKLLTYSPEYLRCQGRDSGWFKDEAGHMDTTKVETGVDEQTVEVKDKDGNIVRVVKNTHQEANALAVRQGWFFENEEVGDEAYHTITLTDRPLAIPFNEDKFLPHGVDMYVTLERATDNFVLMNGENTGYKLYLEKVRLWIDYVTLNSETFQQLQTNRPPFLEIPVTRPKVVTRPIPQGTSMETIHHLFDGEPLPKRIVMGLVDNKAEAGDKAKNPFNFQNFKVDSVKLFMNGQAYPNSQGYLPDFAKKKYMDSYLSLWHGTGARYNDIPLDIKYEEYGEGFTLWAFDFTADQDADNKHLPKTGDIYFELKFNTATTSVVSLVVYAEFEDTIRIDRNNNVSRSWDG